MSNDEHAQTQFEVLQIDSATLMPLVRQALGSETVEVMEWDYQELHRGTGRVSKHLRLITSGLVEEDRHDGQGHCPGAGWSGK